jgi:hypothetical protein
LRRLWRGVLLGLLLRGLLRLILVSVRHLVLLLGSGGYGHAGECSHREKSSDCACQVHMLPFVPAFVACMMPQAARRGRREFRPEYSMPVARVRLSLC